MIVKVSKKIGQFKIPALYREDASEHRNDVSASSSPSPTQDRAAQATGDQETEKGEGWQGIKV